MALGQLEILANILFVVVFFSLCIFVHELGHLLAAIWRGLHVQRFSIGFGKKLWGTRWNGVDYIVSVLPFGGYVALPQLDPTDEPASDDGVPLPHASPGSRSLTAAAGPLANLVFGFFLGLFIWWFGVYEPVPADYCVVSNVPVESPEYRAGLRPGDRIHAVDGKGFSRGWEELSRLITLSKGDISLRVTRDAKGVEIRYRPVPNPDREGLGYPLFSVREAIVVQRVVPRSPAEEAGLQPRDRILAVDGVHVEDTKAFVERIVNSRGALLRLSVERDGEKIEGLDLRARPEIVDGREVFQIGIQFGALELAYPNPWQQFVSVFTQTRDTLRILFAKDSLVRPRHLSGPVGILQVIWYKVKYGGFREGLSFVILVTFSLAFFNLLPIPVLDGGHILYAAIETLTQRRVPAKLAHAVQTVFAALLIVFMLYVTFFDVRRIPKFWRLFRSPQAENVESPAAGTSPPDDTDLPGQE